MFDFPWLAFIVSSIVSFVFRAIVFMPSVLGKKWARAVFPKGMSADAKMDARLILLVLASSIWTALVSVMIIWFFGATPDAFVMFVLVVGLIKFYAFETVGFAKRAKEAVFVELVSTFGGFALSILTATFFIR